MGKPIAMSSDDKRWQAEDDVRTLMRAKEIERDPKRLAAARKCAKEQMDSLDKLQSK